MKPSSPPPTPKEASQRHPILRRINLALVGIGLLSVVIAGTAIYTSLQVRSATNSTVNEDIPDALDINRMLSSLRLMSSNAAEYMLGQGDEYSAYLRNVQVFRDTYGLVAERGSSGPQAESLREANLLVTDLHEGYQLEVFEAYNPDDRIAATETADRIRFTIAAPLESRLRGTATDLRDSLVASDTTATPELNLETLAREEALLRLVDEAGDMAQDLNRHLLSDPEGEYDFYRNAAEFERWLTVLQGLDNTRLEQVEIDEVNRQFTALRSEGNDLFGLYSPENRQRAVNSLDNLHQRYFVAAEDILAKLALDATGRASAEARELSTTGDLTLFIVVLLILVTAALFGAIATFVRRSIYDPIVTLGHAVATLRRGERTLHATPTNDELGDVYQGLLDFQSELNELDSLREKEREQRVLLEREHARVTEAMDHLRETQEQLVSTQRLAALGSLVAGVAHEVNTPVGAAVTVGTTIGQRLREFIAQVESGRIQRSMLELFRSDIEEGLRVMLAALDQASELIANFKQVAVDQSSENRRSFEIETHLNEVVNTLKHQLRGSGISVGVVCTTDAVLDSYPGPFGQVISNLFANALAHGFGGRDSGTIEIAVTGTGDEVSILFADDGVGIPPEHLARVFDPFYTTKLGQGGSGLGLHIVQNIVTGLLGGEISVQSLVGRGTTFKIRLPLVAPEPDPGAGAPDGDGVTAVGSPFESAAGADPVAVVEASPYHAQPGRSPLIAGGEDTSPIQPQEEAAL